MTRPVSIRRSLLLNLVLVIALLSGGILVITYWDSRRKAGELAESLTNRSLQQTEDRLRAFFDPVVKLLLVARAWGMDGVLDSADARRMDNLFVPLVERHEPVSSVMIADERGQEYLLLRTAGRWQTRQTKRAEWGDRTFWREWTEEDSEPAESWRVLDYDPRMRPWFVGAMALRRQTQSGEHPTADSLVYWTEPYQFYTTKEPGITAAVSCDLPQGVVGVVGFDVALTDISKFTSDLPVGQRGGVAVLTNDRRIIGLPRPSIGPDLLDENARRNALLRHPLDLGWQLAKDASDAILARGPDQQDAVRFASGGEHWWVQAKPFDLTTDRPLWITVVVPEEDLLGAFARVRIPVLVVSILVLLGAVVRAIVLSRRFSRPIEDLVAASDRISHGNLDPGKPIGSPIVEVRRLAEAQERMRVALRSLLKIERDLHVARQIQQNTFPRQLPEIEGFQIAAWSEPADETGGDTYDVIGYQPGRDGSTNILVEGKADRAILLLADATGHGIGPALSVTQVRAMLRMAARVGEDFPGIARHMNEQLCADLTDGRFVTAWLGQINAGQRTLTSLSAGQGPILRYDVARSATELIPVNTFPFGIVKDLDVSPPRPIPLRPGDIVAVLSDGVFESAARSGELFGLDRVSDLLVRHKGATAREILDAVRAALDEFTEDVPPADDRTGIILKCTEEGAKFAQ
jgi:serine phosphatase RsbU (regulator of sigma subunit)